MHKILDSISNTAEKRTDDLKKLFGKKPLGKRLD
jgi:hypothetical protein